MVSWPCYAILCYSHFAENKSWKGDGEIFALVEQTAVRTTCLKEVKQAHLEFGIHAFQRELQMFIDHLWMMVLLIARLHLTGGQFLLEVFSLFDGVFLMAL